MLLDARFLKDVGGVNSWVVDDEPRWYEGDAQTLHIQLVDGAAAEEGRRYMPAVGATLEVTLDSVDDAKRVTRFATQPFAQDGSIWRLDIGTTDPVRGTVSVRLKLTEGAAVHRAVLTGALRVNSTERQ